MNLTPEQRAAAEVRAVSEARAHKPPRASAEQIAVARRSLTPLRGGDPDHLHPRSAVVHREDPRHAVWMGMVRQGLAVMSVSQLQDGTDMFGAGHDRFRLTTAGALAALLPGQRISRYDFPSAA